MKGVFSTQRCVQTGAVWFHLMITRANMSKSTTVHIQRIKNWSTLAHVEYPKYEYMSIRVLYRELKLVNIGTRGIPQIWVYKYTSTIQRIKTGQHWQSWNTPNRSIRVLYRELKLVNIGTRGIPQIWVYEYTSTIQRIKTGQHWHTWNTPNMSIWVYEYYTEN